MDKTSTRRYDLDWIRVIAFGILIFYHIGMFFNSEGWHVKSVHMNDTVDHFMWLSSPFRMSLLFLISGVALRYATDKTTSVRRFAGRRFGRLFIPLVFGMLVIVTPQAYFELLAKGELTPGYLDFYGRYLSGEESFSITVPTWNHLWYVVYLLVYTLLLLPLLPVVRKLADMLDRPWFGRMMGGGRLLVLPAAIFITCRFTTDMDFPENHALWGDWGAHARYGSYFLIGFLLAKNVIFWDVLARTWRIAAAGTLVLAVSLSLLWANWDNWFDGITWIENIVRALRPLYAWVIIMAILGAGQAYLNRPGKWLSYCTEAVFPWYILHQTLIVVTGALIDPMGLGIWTEFFLIMVVTIGGCLVIHEYLIRRTPLLRPLFGVPMMARERVMPAQPQIAE
ncbi:acyltransferase family protein [Emcibacter sp.]|uniref:acyltransferase family protein n=1 Tax=Emcibacter sp. TaxID=1979954 RepID=UPI002AA87EE8|nr:acyltransferase family protein [Emcibacter sp.]